MTAEIAHVTEERKVAELNWRNWACLVAYIINALFTGLSIPGVFGPTNGELSAKYQLLITPAGFAFSIWGPIFLWEGTFAVAQMLPQFRNSTLVALVTPGWLLACVSQALWSVVFAQERLTLQLLCMLGIFAGLLAIAVMTDGVAMTWQEYFLLRGGFSLHCGWIIAATALAANVVADGAKSPPEQMLGLAVVSIGVICIMATIFALVKKSADPIICCVAAWAFNGIRVELSDPQLLDNKYRHNFHEWDRTTLEGLELAAGNIATLCLILAVAATVRTVASMFMHGGTNSKRASTASVQMLQLS